MRTRTAIRTHGRSPGDADAGTRPHEERARTGGEKCLRAWSIPAALFGLHQSALNQYFRDLEVSNSQATELQGAQVSFLVDLVSVMCNIEYSEFGYNR
jgi:hypothetical protein